MKKNSFDAKQIEELSKKSEKFWKTINECKYETLDQKQKAFLDLGLAPTKKYSIYKENTMNLYRYFPKKKVATDPVVIVPSLINKNYILDLLPGFSLVEYLVNQGVDVYIIDWGHASNEHSELDFDDYIDTYINRAVKRAMRESNAKNVHIFGQCIGGIFATIYAAKYAKQGFIKSLTNLTTPVDFAEAGMLKKWTNPKTFNLDKVVNSFKETGCIPDGVLHMGFPFLDVNLTFNKYKNLFNFVDNAGFVTLYKALDFWANDNVPFPGEVFRKFIRELYQKNSLINGELYINDEKIDLKNITVPVYNVIAKEDHVFPACCAKGWRGKVHKNDKEEVFDGGHVSIVAALPIKDTIYKNIDEFIKKNN